MEIPNHYDGELQELAHSYAAACTANIELLKLAIASAAESSMIGVGSGGSFTAASLLCSLHETYTGRVSRPSTPLEIICSPALASSSPVFLVSAEGKNPDIVEALERARHFSSRTVHVLTNRQDSPLMEHVRALPGVKPYVFELAKKDGYLATNSLLLDCVLIARAYGELNGRPEPLPAEISALSVGGQPVDAWCESSLPFIEKAVRRGALTVVYSPLLRPIAIDLESKLSEGALLHTQLADLRSYAHGRHLWLAQRPADCAILALVEPSLTKLWEEMRSKFPVDIPTFTMPLAGSDPVHLIVGLVAQMHMVAAVGRALGVDPGRPDVPAFGREIHYANLRDAIPLPVATGPAEEQSKYEVLGAHWPTQRDHGTMRRAAQAFTDEVRQQCFKAIVFDYDGTLCSSQSKDEPPAQNVVDHLVRLARAGTVIGIASGRGGSIQTCLEKVVPPDVLPKIRLALYNGGWITSLYLGLSDGARTNELRRASDGDIGNEQIWQAYELGDEKAADMLKDLGSSLKDAGFASDNPHFNLIWLLDDFSASGNTYIRYDSAERKFKGKLPKIYQRLHQRKMVDPSHYEVFLMLYTATRQAIDHIEYWSERFTTANGFKPLQVRVLCPIEPETSLTRSAGPELKALLANPSYVNNAVVDKHFLVGGTSDASLGFAGCALPVVLGHNTPNNSVYLLWGPEQFEPHGLFPRVSRHREF